MSQEPDYILKPGDLEAAVRSARGKPPDPNGLYAIWPGADGCVNLLLFQGNCVELRPEFAQQLARDLDSHSRAPSAR